MFQEARALVVHQWLPSWDEAEFSEAEFRRKPSDRFYLMAMSAATLRRLVGIYRRSTGSGRPRARDLGIQRAHDVERSSEIREFVDHGFPWSSLSAAKRKSGQFADLVKPGWLPTAIVVNVLTAEDDRDGKSVHPSDLISITRDKDGSAIVRLPGADKKSWQPKGVPPIEVIDGQHRLWAFENAPEDYELPVVLFHGLDRSWQAYLFYTINIKPKRINTSLAFDLYPLLRTEDWLEKFEGHSIYRETRAQELTEALWSFPQSPWRQRINMLGERGTRSVTQASWVRSLLATIVKSWEGRGVRIGGLFGAPVGQNELVLPWTRAQQAAFLIHCWKSLAESIEQSDAAWAETLRYVDYALDPAFAGQSTLTNTDVGVRGVLFVFNDLCYVLSDHLGLDQWTVDSASDATSETAVTSALKSLRSTRCGKFVSRLSTELATYDWRTSAAAGLTEPERRGKARFRGSSGYKELRTDLLEHLAGSRDREIKSAAVVVLTLVAQ